MLDFSHQGKTVPELAQFFEVSNITIYNWFDRWEKQGVVGLLDKPGRGRKPLLSLQNPRQVETVKAIVGKNAQSVKTVATALETVIKEKMSVDTVKRFLKNLVTVSAASAPASNTGRWVLNEKLKKPR